MCSPATCPSCNKITWRGCGMHVDAVMVNVTPENRCECSVQPAQPAAWFPRRAGDYR